MREYLEAWLRPVVVREAPARLNAKQRAGVLLWLATGAVDRGSAFYGGQMHEHAARATVAFLQKHQLKSFPLLMEFATAKLAEDHERHLVALAVQVMTREQLRWFARYIAIDLNDPAFAYRIDEGYLRLKRKAEIIELWNTSAMSSKLEPNLSTSQLRDWCLEVNARQKIGVPADIQALYDETEETRVDEDEDDLLDEDDQTVCIGCGCSDFDACPDGCSWVVQGDRRGYMPGGNVGVCSNPACAPHMERFRRRDFTLSEVAEKRVAERDKRRKQDDEQLAEAGGELGEILAAGKKRRMPREV
jgi:hypothetical protein